MSWLKRHSHTPNAHHKTTTTGHIRIGTQRPAFIELPGGDGYPYTVTLANYVSPGLRGVGGAAAGGSAVEGGRGGVCGGGGGWVRGGWLEGGLVFAGGGGGAGRGFLLTLTLTLTHLLPR